MERRSGDKHRYGRRHAIIEDSNAKNRCCDTKRGFTDVKKIQDGGQYPDLPWELPARHPEVLGFTCLCSREIAHKPRSKSAHTAFHEHGDECGEEHHSFQRYARRMREHKGNECQTQGAIIANTGCDE